MDTDAQRGFAARTHPSAVGIQLQPRFPEPPQLFALAARGSLSADRCSLIAILRSPIGAGYNPGYTESMKTAVSVPDDVFRQAEAAARRLRISRSQLYATAISEFLNRQQASSVTERLNAVYSRRPAKLDGALHRAQLKSLPKEPW
jgi:hypothetical protein